MPAHSCLYLLYPLGGAGHASPPYRNETELTGDEPVGREGGGCRDGGGGGDGGGRDEARATLRHGWVTAEH